MDINHNNIISAGGNYTQKGIINISKLDEIKNEIKSIQTITKDNNNGHSKSVRCLVRMNEKMFISGSWDKSMKVWMSSSNDGEYKCIQTITYENNNGHSYAVYCLIRMKENMFISGSW